LRTHARCGPDLYGPPVTESSGTSEQAISRPTGDRGLNGLGETYVHDLQRGTAIFVCRCRWLPAATGCSPSLRSTTAAPRGNGPLRSVEAGAAAGLKLRHDGGSSFRSGHYQAEIDHLGIQRSPAVVYEPDANGVVETTYNQENSPMIERLGTLKQLRARVREFAALLNEHRLERHGGDPPSQARPPHTPSAVLA